MLKLISTLPPLEISISIQNKTPVFDLYFRSSGLIGIIVISIQALVSSLLFSIKPDISPTRVALIQFAGVHVKNTEWSFDAHKNNSELMTAINNIRYIAGRE